MRLDDLISIIPFKQKQGEGNPLLSSVENDHRKVKEGSLFICIKGYTVDGHDLAPDAVKNGAAAIISEKPLNVDVPVVIVKNTSKVMAQVADQFYGHPTQKLTLIGITGTNGKTTISHLIEKLFNDKNQTTGLIGTMYTKIGKEIFETKNTTPDSLTLQKTFHQMVEASVETAVMEVSSHALDMGRVFGCDYDIAVFSNLTQDHLDYHGTMENYQYAKGLLFSRLGNTYTDGKPKYAILNADDQASLMYEKATSANVVTYGIHQAADIKAENIQITAQGSSFKLITPNESVEVTLPLVGKFNIYNCLAAIAVGLVSNIPLHEIIQSLKEIKGVSGRFERVYGGQDFTVLVDYSHTPDSLENALKTINEFAENKVYAIVGCGGDRDKTKRPLMAQVACEYSTNPIFTSDNPRSEDPEAILDDMTDGVPGMSYERITDRKEAIYEAIRQAQPKDVILIAGKGHEDYQIIGKEVIHFDDKEVAMEAIQEKLNSQQKEERV